jgi:hypothetical protein
VQNSFLWETSDKIIENCILIKKKKQSQTSKSVETTSRFSQMCNRYNVEFECHLNFRYRHACFICEIENHFSSQCSSDREQMWSREDSSQKKRDREINAISREKLWLAMLDSLRWIFEFFLYILIDEMLLRDLDSLKKNDWSNMLRNYFDLAYMRVIFSIIQCDAKIEYIDSSQLILNENLIFVNKVSDIITNNVNNQVEKSRISQVNEILEFFILSSFELVSKSNNDWRRIHYLSHYRRDDREYFSSRARLHNDQKRSDWDFSSHFYSDIRSLIVELSMTLLILKEMISFIQSENCTLFVRFIRERATVKINYKWMTITSLFRRFHRFCRFDERNLWIWKLFWDNLSSSRVENQS